MRALNVAFSQMRSLITRWLRPETGAKLDFAPALSFDKPKTGTRISGVPAVVALFTCMSDWKPNRNNSGVVSSG
jgi:hypothetical protein